MKKILAIIMCLATVVCFSQTTVNRLVDFKLGMTYEEIIKEFPNVKDKTKTSISYERVEMSNGVVLTNTYLTFYKNELYGIMSDYNDVIHDGLGQKYGYTTVDDAPFKGYYGSSYKTNVTAVIDKNKIIIVDRKIHKKALTVGF